jgi:hypothetical protein
MPKNPLLGVRIKVDRAKQHLTNLESAIDAYYRSNPYKIIADKDPQTGNVVYRFHYIQPVPHEWGGVVGEIIHALRSSLDNLATALAIHNGTTSDAQLKETYFPIGTTKESFDSRFPKDLKRVSPAARRLVQRIKPYKGGTDAFWRLHQLDIVDKHTALIPVGTGTGTVGIKFPTPALFNEGEAPAGYIPPEMPMITLKLAKKFPLKEGDEIFSMGLTAAARRVGADGPQIDMTADARKKEPNLKFTFQITFGEGQIVDGEPVIPALKQLVDFTERTINIFARHIFKCQW